MSKNHQTTIQESSISEQTSAQLPLHRSQDIEQHLARIRRLRKDMERKNRVDLHQIVWPEGFDRSLLLEFNLSVRMRKAFQYTGILEGQGDLRAIDFLRLPSVGKISFRELLQSFEVFFESCVREQELENTSHSEPIPLDDSSLRWGQVKRLLAPLFASGVDFYQMESIDTTLCPKLVELAQRMDVLSELKGIQIRDLVDDTDGLVAVACGHLSDLVSQASENELIVLQQRIAKNPPDTLKQCATQTGLTSQAVQHIESKFRSKVSSASSVEIDIVASVLKVEFGHIVAIEVVEERFANLLQRFECQLTKKLFQQEVIQHIGYFCEDGFFFDSQVKDFTWEIDNTAKHLVDDVGLVGKETLMEKLPSDLWADFSRILIKLSGLHEFLGSVCIRLSQKAQIKAALISIGEPADREQVAQMSGISEHQITKALSNIPSVVRASRDKWALREWIDDPYDGIVGEILKRVEEDGGVTSVARLRDELPTKFGVTLGSVNSFLNTPKFAVEDGSVRVVDVSKLQLNNLEEVIDGRDQDGNPYWTFVILDRFFDGYSVTGVPPEFAKVLGCEPEGSEQVEVSNLPSRPIFTVGWHLDSTSGAWFGRVSGPLRELGAEVGQKIVVTIKAQRLVTMVVED